MKHDPLFYQHILKKKKDILKKKMGKFHRDKTKYSREKFTLKELNDKLLKEQADES